MKDSITLTKLTFLLLSLDERCDVKIGDFGLMKDGRNMRLESRNPDEQRGKLSVRWMARESITDSIFTSMTDMVRVYPHSRQKPSRTRTLNQNKQLRRNTSCYMIVGKIFKIEMLQYICYGYRFCFEQSVGVNIPSWK